MLCALEELSKPQIDFAQVYLARPANLFCDIARFAIHARKLHYFDGGQELQDGRGRPDSQIPKQAPLLVVGLALPLAELGVVFCDLGNRVRIDAMVFENALLALQEMQLAQLRLGLGCGGSHCFDPFQVELFELLVNELASEVFLVVHGLRFVHTIASAAIEVKWSCRRELLRGLAQEAGLPHLA